METEIKIGNPWSILPIKNNKYARDLTELYLSNRGLNALEKFEDFPNLEEIWLNNNEVSQMFKYEPQKDQEVSPEIRLFLILTVICPNSSQTSMN